MNFQRVDFYFGRTMKHFQQEWKRNHEVSVTLTLGKQGTGSHTSKQVKVLSKGLCENTALFHTPLLQHSYKAEVKLLVQFPILPGGALGTSGFIIRRQNGDPKPSETDDVNLFPGLLANIARVAII